MRKLLADPQAFYKPKKRPSGHDIGAGFGTDNGGAIPSNLLEIPNSESNGQYVSGLQNRWCSTASCALPCATPEIFHSYAN